MRKIFFILVFLLFFNIALAQETEPAEVIQDEEITAENLDVGDPSVLPDNPFYFAKEWWQKANVKLFTINKAKKAEKQLKYANQRLLEAKKLAEKGDEEALNEALEKYDKDLEYISEKISEVGDKDSRFKNVVKNFTKNQFQHQGFFDRLSKKGGDLPEEAKERIREHQEEALGTLSDVLSQIDKEEIEGDLEDILTEIKGSDFKGFKNLEVLKRVEEKVPEEALPAIRQAQQNALNRLKNTLSEMDPDDKEKLSEYIKNISGDENIHFDILEEMTSSGLDFSVLGEARKAKEEAFTKIKEKIQQMNDNQKKEYFKYFQSGEPKRIKVFQGIKEKLQEANQNTDSLEEVTEKAVDNLKNKLQDTQDLKNMRRLQEQIEENYNLQNQLRKRDPEILDQIKERIRSQQKNQVPLKDETNQDGAGQACIQVITPARDPETGQCKWSM